MGVIQHDFRYDGVDASAYGLVVYGGNVDEIAAKSIEAIEIPGRNGVLHLDNGRWMERTQTYMVYIPTLESISYSGRLAWVRTTYGQRKGYLRLEDTFNPDEYSLATFTDAVAPESMAFRTMGIITLTFQCRPERFLKTGDVKLTNPGTVVNPTGMPAKPLIRVYGTGAGTLLVGDQIIYIDSINEYVDLDSDLMDAFKGHTNCNGNIRLDKFPVFEAGSTGVSVTGGLTSVEVTPRWWRL